MSAVPTYSLDERKARDAFEVHSALLKAERSDPALCHNPQWTVLRQDAYTAFRAAFAVLC